jgi:hypothetical protein
MTIDPGFIDCFLSSFGTDPTSAISSAAKLEPSPRVVRNLLILAVDLPPALSAYHRVILAFLARTLLRCTSMTFTELLETPECVELVYRFIISGPSPDFADLVCEIANHFLR